jgi:hypothetical protein
MNKALENTTTFILVYVLLMIPAYLTYVDSSSTISTGSLGMNMVTLSLLLHMGSMLTLCYVCFIRGKLIGKSWLGFIPLIAIAFEFLPALSAIPLVPSVYHALAIVIGSFATASASVPTDTRPLHS